MQIAIAADHGGYKLKEELKKNLSQINFIDLGTNSEDSVDYPDYGYKLAKYVRDKKVLGIAICGTGIGISIACNKVKGIRAALIYDENTAMLARMHNNANIICMGGRTTSLDLAIKMITTFLNTQFEARHQNRLDEIKEIESKE